MSSSSIWRVLSAPVGHPSSLSDEQGFLHNRVELYTKTMFWFLLVFTAGGMVKLLLLRRDFAEFFRFNLQSAVLYAVLTVVVGIDWWLLRRAPRSLGWLRAIDGVGTVGMSAAVGALVFTFPPELPEIVAAFGLLLVLVLRAAIVPSTVARTLVVGVLSSAIFSFFLWLRMHDAPSNDFFRSVMWIAAGSWNLVFTVVTAVISRVIYGLQESVREVMRLGQYVLEEKLGEGGMGSVYLARHALLRRPTAVKMLRAGLTGTQSAQRFEREVRETSRLAHPNTIEIYDYGHTPEGVFYYAMEYLDGLDLEEFVAQFGPLPPSRTIYLLAQVVHALAEAHGVGLIHRDLKPANIMVSNRGGVADMVKVLDFGLVKNVSDGASPAVTQLDVVTGTPQYLAPESMLAPDRVDHRVDLYGVGCTAYYLLTGRPPFEGATVVEVCGHHLHSKPPPPSAFAPAPIPADLEAVVLRCLEKQPDARYGSALDLWAALRACEAAPAWAIEDASDWWAANAERVRSIRQARKPGGRASETFAVDLDRRSPPGGA